MLTLAQFGVRPSTVVGWLLLGFALGSQAGEKEIVINEIMYHPPLEMEDLQYVELFNRGDSTVDLSRWKFTKGISYVFPNQTQLKAGEFLVVCRSTNLFANNY
ncbi:MAG TPA: lamin tail domain-containing protein, partial [Patescibacteria group bacterium]|nr:lamin tail domain-containing protein [Patescibacteria group bacterium]